MKIEIADIETAKVLAVASDVAEVSIYGNNQLYLVAKLQDNSTEYVILKPGWVVMTR